MGAETKIYGVITGDIVKSARLPEHILSTLGGRIGEISQSLEEKYPGVFLFGFTAFRGDSFQALIKQAEKSPEIALRFLLALRKSYMGQRIQARVVVGIGPVKVLPRAVATEGHGEAYTLSGRRLDALVTGERLAIAIHEEQQAKVFDVICALLDAVSQHWTDRQIEALDLAMDGLKQEDIAQKMLPRISQAAVASLLTNASWRATEKAIHLIESEIHRYVSGDSALRRGCERRRL